MSKRKKRGSKSPNLPQEVLDRARAQAKGETYVPDYDAPDASDDVAEEVIEAEEEVTAAKSSRSSASDIRSRRGSSRRRSAPAAAQYSKRRGGDVAIGSDAMQQLLTKPTKFVSEEELRSEYGYVVADIRNMFLLAGALMVLLVILAQFI